jgi:hypothetical protein
MTPLLSDLHFIPFLLMPEQPSFWTNVSIYCSELAAVAGPLLAALGDTAGALERAERHTRPTFDPSAHDPRLLRADLSPESDQ